MTTVPLGSQIGIARQYASDATAMAAHQAQPVAEQGTRASSQRS